MKKLLAFSIVMLLGQTYAMEQNNNQLIQAIENGNIEAVDALLKQGVDPNATTPSRVGPLSALEIALVNNCLPIVKLLIDAQADLETRGFEGHTPLIRMAYENNIEMIKVLLCGKANVNAKSSRSGKTALDYAYEKNNDELMEIIFAFGADISECHHSDAIGKIFKAKKDYLSANIIIFLITAAKNNPNIKIREGNYVMFPVHFLLKTFYSRLQTTDQLHAFYDNQNDIKFIQEKKLLDLIHQQIEKKFNIYKSDSKGFSSLYYPLIHADEHMVEHLLEYDISWAMRGPIVYLQPNPFYHVIKTALSSPENKRIFSPVLRLLIEYYKPYNNNVIYDEIHISGSFNVTTSVQAFANLYDLEDVIACLTPPSLKQLTIGKIVDTLSLELDNVEVIEQSDLPKDILDLMLQYIDRQMIQLYIKDNHTGKTENLNNLRSCIINILKMQNAAKQEETCKDN